MSSSRFFSTRGRRLRQLIGFAALLSPLTPATGPVGAVELLSRAHATLVADSGGGDQPPSERTISGDGRYVVFVSTSANLVSNQVSGPYPIRNVFLRDRVSGQTVLVSHIAGQPSTSPNYISDKPVISADGNFVAFVSQANLIDPTARFTGWSLYLYERGTGALTLVSRRASQPSRPGFIIEDQPVGLSADGRYVAYVGLGDDLVVGQVGSGMEVVLFDRVSETAVLVSHASGEPTTVAGESSSLPCVSADGRFVAFESTATNLVEGQSEQNSVRDVFVFDRETGESSLVSRSLRGATVTGNRASWRPLVSADGAYVVFQSQAHDLVYRQVSSDSVPNVFLFERLSGTIRLVSHATGAPNWAADRGGYYPFVSGDGRRVVFLSRSTNLVMGMIDRNGPYDDVFVYDRLGGTVRLVSARAGAPLETGDDASQLGWLSADGARVAFVSWAGDLVVGQVNQRGIRANVFLRDVVSDVTTLVSHAAGSPTTTGDLYSPSSSNVALDASASVVAYSSHATNLAAGQVDTNDVPDAFAYDAVTGANELLSVRDPSQPSLSGSANSAAAAVSIDGRHVAYVSDAMNLVPGYLRGPGSQLFLLDRVDGSTRLASGAGGSPIQASSQPAASPVVSRDGSVVLFTSTAPDIVPGQIDTNSAKDVFAFDTETGSVELVSHAVGSATSAGDGASSDVSVSADGRWVAFLSTSRDLAAGQVDPLPFRDVFILDRETGAMTLVSHAAGAPLAAGDGMSDKAVISADGRYVAYSSWATNLVAGQVTPTNPNIFVMDRLSGSTTLVSHRAGSTLTGAGCVGAPAVSDAGDAIVFVSRGQDVAPGQVDGGSEPDVFVHDRATNTNRLLSHSSASLDTAANAESRTPYVSASGAWVAYESLATDLLAGQQDTNGGVDVFLVETASGATTLASRAPASALQTGNAPASLVGLSADGRLAALKSKAQNLVAGQAASIVGEHLFVHDRLFATTAVASHALGGTTSTSNGAPGLAALSTDGSTLVFDSPASDLVGTDFNWASDIFAFVTPAAALANRGKSARQQAKPRR